MFFAMTGPTKYLAIALTLSLAFGAIYVKGRFDGANAVELKYAQQKIEWQNKVSDLQSDLAKKDVEIMTAYAKGDQKVKDVMNAFKKMHSKDGQTPGPTIIDTFVSPKADEQCKVKQSFVELHNKAAQGATLEDLRKITPDNTPSDKKLSDVARTVTVNYYEYEALKNKMIALQEKVKAFIEKQKELTNE